MRAGSSSSGERKGSTSWPAPEVPSGKITTPCPAASVCSICSITFGSFRFDLRSMKIVLTERQIAPNSGQPSISALATKTQGSCVPSTMMSR